MNSRIKPGIYEAVVSQIHHTSHMQARTHRDEDGQSIAYAYFECTFDIVANDANECGGIGTESDPLLGGATRLPLSVRFCMSHQELGPNYGLGEGEDLALGGWPQTSVEDTKAFFDLAGVAASDYVYDKHRRIWIRRDWEMVRQKRARKHRVRDWLRTSLCGKTFIIQNDSRGKVHVLERICDMRWEARVHRILSLRGAAEAARLGIKIGDVVRLKSGGLPMTVSRVDHHSVSCAWHEVTCACGHDASRHGVDGLCCECNCRATARHQVAGFFGDMVELVASNGLTLAPRMK